MRHMRVWSYVDEVARTGSLRRAAERLHVTASAVQRRIEDIEHDLGAALFERSAAGMRLTTAGGLFPAMDSVAGCRAGAGPVADFRT